MNHTYVGFGFGAIQSGLLLLEAFRSGAFGRLVVAEVVPDIVGAVRQGGGRFCVNIAWPDRIEQAEVGPIEIENPAVEADRERLIAAVAEAQEIGTAIPAVKFFATDAPGSIHRILAAGLRRKAAAGGPRAVVYTAENHNHAAEILEEKVFEEIPAAERDAVRGVVRFLNTVVGKMSGIVTDPDEIAAKGLKPVTPFDPRAFLVERFNRILITRINFAEPFTRGISVFEEKDDLLPFEFAKLYGHNATHALAAYTAMMRGVETIAELPEVPGMMEFLRAAFIGESGAAMIRHYAGVDPLFTEAGYRDYAEDLLERMTNPFLSDLAERVGRDPQRKLGWEDRLIGTIRLALSHGVRPVRYAFGAAAALTVLDPAYLEGKQSAQALLDPLWSGAKVDPQEKEAVLGMIETARGQLVAWRAAGYPHLEQFIAAK